MDTIDLKVALRLFLTFGIWPFVFVIGGILFVTTHYSGSNGHLTFTGPFFFTIVVSGQAILSQLDPPIERSFITQSFLEIKVVLPQR